jgi:Ankyrin repeats (3 copies)
MLENIPKEQRRHAHRLFQCLIAAIRPLRVEELTEIFAIQFDSKVGPKLVEGWRPVDPEAAVLFACSSLISTVDIEDSRIVQFSHFSVKEFLTSDRLAFSNIENISHYYIPLESAHTTLAQACLTVLLQLDDKSDKKRLGTFPLAFYAAEHWVDYAKFENVALQIGDAMECLFDPTKLHLAAWTWIHERDDGEKRSMDYLSEHPSPPEATPLYYAALCGFVGLAKHLMKTCAQDVNAECGDRGTPLHGACRGGQVECMRLLLENGADVDARDGSRQSVSHLASIRGQLEAVRLLLQHNADVNAKGPSNWTPLHFASRDGHPEVAQLLLEHGADANAKDSQGTTGFTPLLLASGFGGLNVVRLLLAHGADVHMRAGLDWTPFEMATIFGHHDIRQLLLEDGAQQE